MSYILTKRLSKDGLPILHTATPRLLPQFLEVAEICSSNYKHGKYKVAFGAFGEGGALTADINPYYDTPSCLVVVYHDGFYPGTLDDFKEFLRDCAKQAAQEAMEAGDIAVRAVYE